jgi:serine/threonine-protein kinase
VIGKRADHRSDIFSLGIILYEMLTGRPPFNGDNVTALMYQIVNFAPPAPSALNGAVPELLDYVVAKMLAKALEERYQDAQDMVRDLRECEHRLASSAAGTIPPRAAPGLASGPQPEFVDTHAQTVVLAQTLNRTREADRAPLGPTAPPARGLAHTFDSLEATQRLASLTDAGTASGGAGSLPLDGPQTATQAIGAIRQKTQQKGWRRRDWLLVGGAGLLGLIVARRVIGHRRD